MLARLIAYSSDALTNGNRNWTFNIELQTPDGIALTESLSLGVAATVGAANKGGALHQLCRAIRDAKEGHDEALVGAEFRSGTVPLITSI